MLSNTGSVREALKRLGGHKGHVDPIDWIMGHDWAHIKIGRKQGVAVDQFLLDQLARNSSFKTSAGSSKFKGSVAKALAPRIARNGNQAVVKLIRDGGTSTARGLNAQLKYLNRDGEEEVKRSERFFGAVIGEQEQDSLATSWGLDQPNKTGVDKTSHFVVSFPIGTDREAAERAGRAWAEELFDSGKYGDVFDYYTVAHNDTAHPHVHVVVNRRGIERGDWLKISKRGPINYQTIRDVQVEAAAREGIHLDATPRFARGETDRPYTDIEVKRAERENRDPQRPDHTDQTTNRAALAVLSFANQLNAEAEQLSTKLPEAAVALKAVANGLKTGLSIKEMLQSQSIVGNEEAKQMSELLTQSRNEVLDSFSKVDQAIKALPTNSIERIQIERQAADNRAQAGSFVPQLQEDKTRAERDGHYKGVVANDDVSKAIKTKADNKVRTITKRNGLDPDKTLARYDSSNAVHASQTTAWREEERKAAVENGIKPEKVDEVHKEISSVYNSARRNIRQHDDNKRQIIDNARQIKSATDRDQIETLNNDQYTRIKDALTQSQLQRLERGDASQLSNITSDAVTQKALTRDYLDTAAKHAETSERQAQLEQSRTSVDRQLQNSVELQRKQQQQQQRTRNSGIER